MNYIVVIFISCVLALLLAGFIGGLVRSVYVQHQEPQKEFAHGSVPHPDGLYRGSVPGHTFSWQGKVFDEGSATGRNLFKDGGTTLEKYPFKTYQALGVQDSIQVLKIDYNVPTNPWWLRLILDEIVEDSSGKYIGKVHLRIIPGLPFTLGFFYLEKPGM